MLESAPVTSHDLILNATTLANMRLVIAWLYGGSAPAAGPLVFGLLFFGRSVAHSV